MLELERNEMYNELVFIKQIMRRKLPLILFLSFIRRTEIQNGQIGLSVLI